MPRAARRPCAHPGCGALTDNGRCKAHQFVAQRIYDKRRGSAAARGYDAKWKARRDYQLTIEPLCRMCKAMGRVTAATVADHITPHRGDPALFSGPLQSLCTHCHSSGKQRIETPGAGQKSGLFVV